ncbi:MAG TPA: hypothetical protein VNA20_17065 [Frankiaceae bacterium]|nr:hypothetical protein [Frankiaceae bacterium]
MNRRFVTSVVAAAAFAVSAPPVHAGGDRQLVLMAYRTTRGAASLALQVDAPPGKQPSVIAMVVATVDRGRIESIDHAAAVLSGEADSAQVRANGSRTVLCESGACVLDTSTEIAGGAVRIDNDAGDDRWNVLFVVARGRSATYRATAKGWTVKRVSLPFRVVTGQQATDAGAYAVGAGVEVFRQAAAHGGGTGSLAVAEPPCSEATTGAVSRGIGTLTLDGGVKSDTYTCPADRGALAGWATRRTTWRVHGTAAGDSTMAGARLVVLDLPRSLPVPRTWPWR